MRVLVRNKARPPAQQRARVGAAREASPCDRPSPFLGWLVIALPAVVPAYSSFSFIFPCQSTRTSGPVLSRREENVQERLPRKGWRASL